RVRSGRDDGAAWRDHARVVGEPTRGAVRLHGLASRSVDLRGRGVAASRPTADKSRQAGRLVRPRQVLGLFQVGEFDGSAERAGPAGASPALPGSYPLITKSTFRTCETMSKPISSRSFSSNWPSKLRSCTTAGAVPRTAQTSRRDGVSTPTV